MALRKKFIFLFAGLSLLGNGLLFLVTYDSVKNYKIQETQRDVAVFAQHLEGVLSLAGDAKGFARDQLNQLADILPDSYIPIVIRGGVFILPNEAPPLWLRQTLRSPDFLQDLSLSVTHMETSDATYIWHLGALPNGSDQLLVMHKPETSIWQDYQEVFMLPLTVTTILTTWAAIWIAIILSSLYAKLKNKNVILAEQKQTIEASLETLNQVNKAKSQFLANMSHEIRTPLTAIIGFADTSLDQEQTAQERNHALTTIKNCGQHLLHVINEVLDISKIEAGKLDIDATEVNLFRLIQEVESVFRQQANIKGISFSIHYGFPLPMYIHSDLHRLRQILFNLCSNALKFTHQGHTQISVGFDRASDCVQFDVADTGIGISNEQITKIFDSFTQADTSTTRNYGGTGLGLTLSRQLAELLNGSLTVQSEPGKGSCFQLSIDAGTTPQTEFIRSVAQIPVIDNLLTTQGDLFQTRQRILVAEDNLDNQRLISIYLQKTGADFTIVENGALALEYLQHHTVNLILLDIQMPVLDGFSTLKQIRATGNETPVIALTANTLADDKQHCLAAGFSDFIAKPIDRQKFYKTLSQYLSVEQADAPARIYSTLENDDIDFSEAIEFFIQNLPQQLEAIHASFAQQDWKTFASLIHQVKGSAGGVGFPHLTELATQIETAYSHNEQARISSLLQEVEEYCARINGSAVAANQN